MTLWVEKLPIQFDIKKLRADFEKHVLNVGDAIIQGEEYGSKFGGWSVLSANGDWKNGMTSGQLAFSGNKIDYKIALEKEINHEFNYKQKTKLCVDYIEEVIDTLDNMGLYPRRARFTVLKSGGESTIHKDTLKTTDYATRIHIPIITNDKCVHILYDNDMNEIDRIHMPADGSAYILKVNHYHQIINESDEDRFHLIMNSWDTNGVTENMKFDKIKKLEMMANVFQSALDLAKKSAL